MASNQKEHYPGFLASFVFFFLMVFAVASLIQFANGFLVRSSLPAIIPSCSKVVFESAFDELRKLRILGDELESSNLSIGNYSKQSREIIDGLALSLHQGCFADGSSIDFVAETPDDGAIITFLQPILSAGGAMAGIWTMYFIWRRDRRETEALKLKVAELQMKINQNSQGET